MGIYIKSMRLPENCIKCPMQFGGMCYVMPAEVDESRVASTVEEALKQGKPDWCPLVEIPEHGRLIDADKMCADLATVDPQYETMIDWCIQVTNAQPTVIEGSENHDD